jgi:nucleoside-diphosphate-sugar epimerase
MIAATESTNTIGQSYLLGESPPYSWKEIMDAMSMVMNRRAITIRLPFIHLRNVAYLRHRYWRVDTRKAERDFSYISRHRLADGLALTARWPSDQHLL